MTTLRPSNQALLEFANGHNHCLVCGSDSPGSWGLRFSCDTNGAVFANFVAGLTMQGYDTQVHGGVIASLLDAAMTHCLFHQSIQAVTGDLRVRYLHPVACNVPLELRARLLFACPPLYQLQAELHCDGQVMARAEGKFMRRGCHDSIDGIPADQDHHSR